MSVRFIVDTSVAVAAAMGENSSQAFLDLMGKAFRSGYLVPAHWRLEVANAVIENLRRNRKSESEAEKYIQDIGQAFIDTDPLTSNYSWTRTFKIALRNKLAMYDAAYVELAVRTGFTLLTLDKTMARAAKAEGVLVLPN